MLTAADLMTAYPVCIEATESPSTAAGLLRRHGFRHLPVTGTFGVLSGMVSDARIESAPDGTETVAAIEDPVEAVLLRDTPISVALTRLMAARQGVAVIVDDAERPVGILTESDLVRTAVALLPEDEEVAELPSRRVFAIQRVEPARNAMALMEEHGIRHVLVLDGNRLDGVLSWRDLEARGVLDGFDLRAADILGNQSVCFTTRRAPLVAVARMMSRQRIGCVPVLDGPDAVGVYTRIDVVEALRSRLALTGG